MRALNEKQQLVLDRISDSAASTNVKVVGWAVNGPILQTKRGWLVALLPNGRVVRIAT